MPTDIELLRTIERAPLRTARYADLEALGNNVWRQLDRLADRGGLIRLAKGVYTVPPDGQDGRHWKPALETAGLAVATARIGNRNAVLMGLGAARHWTAIPRAIGVTTIAVPGAIRPAVELEHGGTLFMIPRDLEKLDVILERTELGDALVTTPAQTMYDLLMRPNQGKMPAEALTAARNLSGQVDAQELRAVCAQHGRANTAIRQTLRDLEEIPNV